MKNSRSYRLSALLLAVIMLIGIMPTAALAAEGNVIPGFTMYSYTARNATFTYASDSKAVNSIADLDPNKVSTMTVTVPGGEGLPTDNNGTMAVAIPQYVLVSESDAKSCQSTDVNCSVEGNMLVFKWSGTAKADNGFKATLTITPNAPATREDVSGTKVLVVYNNNEKGRQHVAVLPTIKKIDGVNRLTGEIGMLYEGQFVANISNLPTWTIQRKTGDWYSIAYGKQYLVFGNNGNHVSFSDTPSYYLYGKAGAGDQFIATGKDGKDYYLNNKNNNISKGIQASTYNDQSIEILTRYKTGIGNSLVTFNINGGSIATTYDAIMTSAGTTITLPNYTGKKSNNAFIGWALYSNIYEYHGNSGSSYCEVYFPGTEFTVPSGQTTLYAVYNEKGTKVRFGFRIDKTIPHEPSNYTVKEYTGHMEIENTLKIGKWVVDVDTDKPIEGNHIANDVAANLKTLPTDEQIKEKMPEYDPETMYVHWYVLKYSGQWKVDGVIRNREAKSVGYEMNIEGEDRNYIQNKPSGYTFGQRATIQVGAGQDGVVKTPSLANYEFLGWNTKADGTGTSYESGAQVELTENTTFYAQWREIPKYEVAYQVNDRVLDLDDDLIFHVGETVTMPEMERKTGYIFSGWMIDGVKVEDSTIIMPDNNVQITGTYYGPISVIIRSDWPDGKAGYSGAKIKLTAELIGAEGLDCDLQWQYLDGEKWTNVENATEITMVYDLNEETSGRIWRVIVTDARPHQD